MSIVHYDKYKHNYEYKMPVSTSKTITFDVNKFLTYEDFLKSIYDTMGGGNLYQHIQM